MDVTGLINFLDHDDIHVVAGHPSPELWTSHLRITTESTQSPASSILGTSLGGSMELRFTPVFRSTPKPGALVPSLGLLDTIHEGFSIRVSERTGRVETVGTLPALRPFNFQLEARLTDPTDPDFEPREYIFRVHVHTSVKELWMTPATLTLRPLLIGDPRTNKDELPRFSVRARFEDDVIGDVTDDPDLKWDTTGGHADSSGYLDLATVPPGTTATIKAHLTYAAAQKATGLLTVRSSWTSEPPIVAVNQRYIKHDPAATQPPTPANGFQALQTAPNFLILGDGFTDKGLFDSIVRAIVDQMNQPLCQPFGVLRYHINFWSAFIGSKDNGSSTGAEVKPDEHGTFWARQEVDAPGNRTDTATKWSAAELAYMVGWPLPADISPTTGRNDDVLRAHWTAMVGFDPTPQLGKDSDIQAKTRLKWRAFAKSSIVDDVDCVFHTKCGMQKRNAASAMGFARGRMDRARLDEILDRVHGQVHDQHGQPAGAIGLGHLWKLKAEADMEPAGEEDDGSPESQLQRRKPKDYDMVLILVPQAGRSFNSDGYLLVSLFDPFFQVTMDAVTGRLKPDGTSAPVGEHLTMAAMTTAHEVAHSFGLGDEYSEFDGVPLFQRPPTSNIQGTSASVGNNVNGKKIQWRWHRIDHAGELSADMDGDPMAGEFNLWLKVGHRYGFALEDVVLLRQRTPFSPILSEPKVSVPLRIKKMEQSEFQGVPMDRISLELVNGVPFDYPQKVMPANILDTFRAGSIMYRPFPSTAPANTDGAPYAELIHWKTVQYFKSNKPALSGNIDAFLTATGFPKDLQQQRIVAYYPGGDSVVLERFHPTGHCQMGAFNGYDPRKADPNKIMSEFCAVCRYALVDFIHPRNHGWNDLAYAKEYPKG